MGVLLVKLRREVWQSVGAMLLVAAIITVGTGEYIGMASAQRILSASQKNYYNRYRFADFWIDLKKAPLTAVEPIAELPGVAGIDTRVVFDVIIDLPDVIRPLQGRMISTPPEGCDRTINGLCIKRGSGFSDDRDEEIILSDPFAKAHGLEPGDRIQLILNRKRESFVVVGTAISPEYVYLVRGAGDIIPDPKHFGVLYIKEKYAREALDFQDACNQIVGQMIPGSQAKVEPLLEMIDRMLSPYGVLATTPRERQASHRFLSDEIGGLKTFSIIVPAIFLTVAVLVLNILMSRLAERQRTIIGTLKALGYSDRQVMTHFLMFGVVVGGTGGLGGIALGLATAYGMIEMYKDFFELPSYVFEIYIELLVTGMAISIGFALAGTAKGARRVLRLAPAQAMRPAPPERGGSIFLERFPFLWRRFGFRTHMALRSLARHRGRTAATIISMSLGTAIILVALSLYDSAFFMLDYQFDHVLHSDVDIALRNEASAGTLLEARQLPGVDSAEPLLGVVCDLRHGPNARRMAITGLAPGHRLITPMQADLTPVDIPPQGLVLSAKLAEILDAQVGDTLELTPVRGRRETVAVPVASTIDVFVGLECYANLHYLSRIVGEAMAVNSIQLAVNPTRQEALYRTIKKLPNTQGLNVRNDARMNLETTFIETMSISLTVLILFAGVIAFGSILNTSLVEAADRVRDISSLRVLGYHPNEIAGIFFRQNLITFAVSLLLAVPIGYLMVLGSMKAYDTELFRMPIVFRFSTVMVSSGIALVFVLIAQWFVRRHIHKLDWLEGVKTKE